MCMHTPPCFLMFSSPIFYGFSLQPAPLICRPIQFQSQHPFIQLKPIIDARPTFRKHHDIPFLDILGEEIALQYFFELHVDACMLGVRDAGRVVESRANEVVDFGWKYEIELNRDLLVSIAFVV